MIEMAKLIDRANELDADISIWSKRTNQKDQRWEVRVHRGRDLRVTQHASNLVSACIFCLNELEGLE